MTRLQVPIRRCMLSNVPGPPTAAFLCGERIEEMMFYSFVAIGTYVGVLSYNGKVSVGISSAPSLEPDVSRIAKHWKPAYEEMLAAARHLPPLVEANVL